MRATFLYETNAGHLIICDSQGDGFCGLEFLPAGQGLKDIIAFADQDIHMWQLEQVRNYDDSESVLIAHYLPYDRAIYIYEDEMGYAGRRYFGI